MDLTNTLQQIDLKIEELKTLKSDLVGSTDTFFADTLSKIKAKPNEIVCKDYLPLIKGALNIIAGSGGVGKSTIALKSALHYLRANEKENALLVMGEDSKDVIEKRIYAIGKNDFMLDSDEISAYLQRMLFITTDNDMPTRFLQKVSNTATLNTGLITAFHTYVKENHIGFVVLDPLKKFHSCNENDNSEMDLLVRDVFLSAASKLKIVVLVLHHSAKSLDARGARGASTITDTARIAYKIAKKYKKDENGEMVEDEEYAGKVRVTTIKDNNNIFWEYGRSNTDDGMIELYKSKRQAYTVEYRDDKIPDFSGLPA